MSNPAVSKPDISEYGAYFGRYITLVADADIVAVLENQLKSTRALLEGISEEKSNHRYQSGKWSVKEVAGHIADSERVFAYRALRFARNDKTALPGFDQETFAANADFANLALSDIIREYEAVRQASIQLFRNLGNDAWNRRGVANNNDLTVRAIAFTIAGHELHHLDVLKKRYL